MVRYDAGHKQATRERILETAGRRLKADGIDGSGVATLMKDAGLTNGAFYAHFESKDALVAQVLVRELTAQLRSMADDPDGVAGVRQMVGDYLTTEHRDNVPEGCPSAAMLDEIVRAPLATREAFSQGLLEIIDELAGRLAGSPDAVTDQHRAQVLSGYALMVGTMQFARTLTDEALSREVIARGLENAMTIFESVSQSA